MVPGLVLRVNKSGTKTFSFHKRIKRDIRLRCILIPAFATSATNCRLVNKSPNVVSRSLPPWWSTRPWKLPTPERLNDAHLPAAAGAWLPQCHRDDIGGGCVLLHCWLRAEQRADPGKVAFAGCAGQQAVVTNAVEPAREHMDEEPAQELVRIKRAIDLHTLSTFDPVVFPAEHHGSGISADKAAIGDGNPMRITAEICQHGFGPAEGWFGIDHPFGLAKRRKPGGKCINVCQPGQIAEEGELSRPMQRDQAFDELKPQPNKTDASAVARASDAPCQNSEKQQGPNKKTQKCKPS